MTTLSAQLTPKQIVTELDRYIVGQHAAKKAVAIALRNRWRRQQLATDLRDEVMPKNIIMIGPTGVGKTEIARRLAKLAGAPFVKVEASKFTEVGYVGRDVDSMIRDLAETAVTLVKAEATDSVQEKAKLVAEERLLDVLLPTSTPEKGARFGFAPPRTEGTEAPPATTSNETREKFRQMLRDGKLEDRQIELEVREKGGGTLQVFTNSGIEEMGLNLQEMLGGRRTKKRKVTIAEARVLVAAEEAERLVDMDAVLKEAVTRAEQAGIVFIDEIDKVSGKGSQMGPDVSRQGVQRDLLPIVEGSAVTTKYGVVRTDHILFIAAGAFHITKVSDLIPELQGRFPIRVELEPLGRADLERILREPKNSLVKQYCGLLATEGVELEITDDAIAEIARVAQEVNELAENIGARRLHSVMEKLLEEVSFDADTLSQKSVVVDGAFVRAKLDPLVKNEDLANYIL
jgi:ATP-dependent HslUV protease ATP-binding subunit HslU